VWCFGDSSGIDFNNLSTPQAIHSKAKSRGTCASIADSTGNLLFYTSYNTELFMGGNTLNGEVYNANHNLMVNGDSIFYTGWYQEAVIIPFPNDSSRYYLFSLGVSPIFGLYYSIVDMTLDSGRGAVTLKNVQLNNYPATDGIAAVKHGNGRDWWVLVRRSDTLNDEFYEFLISPSGISGPFIINSGTIPTVNTYFISFSTTGNKFVATNFSGLIDLFDFDRCTGTIILNQNISPASTMAPYPYYFGSAFSQNDNFLFMSSAGVNHPSYLIQYDLSAPVISLTADTLWTYSSSEEAGGQLRLAPDGKIYLACGYSDGITYPYPYDDTLYNTVNNNLSVINYPDSPGVSCQFQPFIFNLGAGRTYWGLPNNPDYELGPVAGSLCDTVLTIGTKELAQSKNELSVFYHADWQVFFVNAQNIKGKNCLLQIFDLNGREVFSSTKKTQPPYFTEDINLSSLSNGMYFVKLQTEKESLVKKFIKE
jgi:hypothetical protein